MVKYYTPVSEADYMTPVPKRGGRSLLHRARFGRYTNLFTGKLPFTSFVMPGGGVGGGFAKAGKGILSFAKRATLSPFSGMTFKKAALSGLGTAFGVPAAIEGTKAIYSAASGRPYKMTNWKTMLKTAIGAPFVPAVVRPIAALAGFGRRGGGAAVAKGTEIYQTLIPGGIAPRVADTITNPFPTIPSARYRGGDVNIMTPAPPAGESTIFAPSISAGGGGGVDPMMLAVLAGAGLLGYGIGRRRRKKKKKRKVKKR